MLSYRHLLYSTIAVALCVPCLAQDVIHLPSAGMETDADANGLPDGWGRYISNGTARTAVDPEVKRSGEGSLRIEIDDDSRCTVTHLVKIDQPGDYTFGGWIKTSLPPDSLAHLYIQWRKGGQIVRSEKASALVRGESDWTEVTALGTRPEGADSALLVIVVQVKQAGATWADDMYFKPGSHPVAGLQTVAVAALPQDRPTLLNPSFEEGGDQPEAWSKAIHGKGFVLSRDAEEAHSGGASIKLIGEPGHGSRACYLQTTQPFKPSVAVRLKLWYKGKGKATHILRFRPSPAHEAPGGQYGSTDLTIGVEAQDWTEYTLEAPVPKEARDAGTVQIELILYQKGEGSLWYDDVSLESLDEWVPKLTEAQSALICPTRPEDGRVVLQNPPDFSWTPQYGAVEYTLQLSADAAFPEDATIQVDSLKYNVFSYSEALGNGTWHWRVRFTDEGGHESDWTNARSFVVTDAAKPFLVPPVEEMLARIPEGHPRIYATAESLADFRAPMDGKRKDWWERFRARIDGFAAREIDPEPPQEWVYGMRSGPLTDDIIQQGNKLRGYCGGITTRTQDLAFGYLLSDDVKYAQAAIAQMMEMASWDPMGITSYRNHDQVFRDITWKMACAYDWCYEVMTDEQRETIRDAVVTRAGQLYRDFAEDAHPIYEYPLDSHGITSYGFLGICAIALAHESPEADEWFRFVGATYPAIFPPWGGEEGGWAQGVAYWKWSSPFAWWFYDALLSATGVNMYDKAWQRNDGWYKIYMHPPWCDRHHFGDGNHGAPGATDQSNLAHLAHVYDNEYFQWYAKNLPGWPGGGIYGYWWYDRDLPARPPADVPQGSYFPDIGWVAMHSDLSDPDDIMLMFKSSRFGSYNHSHADQNSFVLYAYGEPLLIDSGYYDWYGSPHDVGWTRQTKAHNDILVNGEGQNIFDITATGKITDHFTSPWFDYTAGDATAAYKGKLKSFTRQTMYLRPDVFLIIDDLEAPEPSEFTWCLHAENEMALRPDSNEVTITRGGAKCLVKFITPEGLSFEQNDEFTPPSTRDLKNEWHTYATTTEKTAKVRFVTLVRPYRAGEESLPEVTGYRGERLVGVKLREDYEHHAVLGSDPIGEGIDDFDVMRSGRFWASAQSGNRQVDALVDGTLLHTYGGGGAAQFKSSAPVTCAIEYTGPHNIGVVKRVWYDADEACEMKLLAYREDHGERVAAIDLDGIRLAADDWSIEKSDFEEHVVLRAPAGTHTIEINPEPQAAQVGQPVTLKLAGEALDMDVESMQTPTGGVLTWGSFNAPPGPAEVQVAAPRDAVVQVGREELVSGQIAWLTEANELFVRTRGEGAKVEVDLDPVLVEGAPLDASVVDESIVDAPGSLKFEAETFSNFGNGSVRAYSHRKFLSGGQGCEMQVAPGQWTEWVLNVPEAGTYNLIFKGAAHEENAERLIEIDGKPVSGEFRRFRFPFTGGFGATPGEWKHMRLSDADGAPIAITLDAGKHTLRLSTLARKLNLDYIVLARAE